MNLEEFANDLLSQCEELQYLRMENARLRNQVEEFRESQRQELQMHQNNAFNILGKLLDKAEVKS